MNAAINMLVEYVKFITTFTLLTFSAEAWFLTRVAEIKQQSTPFRILLLLSFTCSCISAYFLSRVMLAGLTEIPKMPIDQNFTSEELKAGIRYSSWALYGAAFFVVILATFKTEQSKIK